MKAKKKQNESALVCAARRGDKEAMRLLLGRNLDWLKGLVYSIVDDVDDVMQDICVRLIDKIDTLREPERFRPWLAVMAKRLALSYRRRKKRRPILISSEELACQHSDENGGRFIKEIEQAEQYHKILEAVNVLPDKYREVFMMAYAGELTYRQIADILNVPITTVQIRLVRARRMIYRKITGKDKDKIRGR
ncbi:RNA polymerase sigma factor [Planctomycetota bacterium]